MVSQYKVEPGVQCNQRSHPDGEEQVHGGDEGRVL